MPIAAKPFKVGLPIAAKVITMPLNPPPTVSVIKVDTEKVRASLPHGIVTVKAVKGGLDVPDPEGNDPAVIASAAVCVHLELP